MIILQQKKVHHIGCKIKKVKNFPRLGPFHGKNGNSYIITLCILLKGIFLRNSLKKKPSKSDEK
jgi:hypothetical protein